MADLPEQEAWEGVRQLETSDRALGGPGGVMNVPLRNLANRTAYLKKVLEGKTGVASTTTAGIVKLSSAVDSVSESDAATSAAVKVAYDAAVAAGSNANNKLSKSANLSDVADVSQVLTNLGLNELALVGAATGVLGAGVSRGYFKIPGIIEGKKRELIIQWYTAISSSAGTFTFNFPIPFPNAFFADAAMAGGSGGSVVNGGSVSMTARQLYFSAPMSVAVITVGW